MACPISFRIRAVLGVSMGFASNVELGSKLEPCN